MDIQPRDKPSIAGLAPDSSDQHRKMLPKPRPAKPEVLRVLKFGGTSLRDAFCIEKVAAIIRDARRASNVVVVASAISGITNKLVEATALCAAGDYKAGAVILEELRGRHVSVANTLLAKPWRQSIVRGIDSLFKEAESLLRLGLREAGLTPRIKDAIVALGERLSAPLLAASLTVNRIPSEAVDATELIITDSNHGAANPNLNLTRARCISRLRPLLRKQVVPVVTGFIGSTQEGVLTTLGRNSSDYSATVLAAGLDASEVIIWTDVDGVLTADPRVVPEAVPIREISYREANELAQFGARVLHPKTLQPVAEAGIPISIRNTFSPEKPGTQIVPGRVRHREAVKALAAISRAAYIAVRSPNLKWDEYVESRALVATATAFVDPILIWQSRSGGSVNLVVPSARVEQTLYALRCEFKRELACEKSSLEVDTSVAVVTLVGHIPSQIDDCALRALEREGIKVIGRVQGNSDCSVSFVLAENEMAAGINAMHREFELALTVLADSDHDTSVPRAAQLSPM